jgi:predicted RNA-binding Zn ribbon-like protein
VVWTCSPNAVKGPGVRDTARVEGRKLMSQPKPSFRFNAGRLSLNLVCTVRHRPSKNLELLREPSDFSRWLFQARVIPQLASVSAAEFDDAKRLRKAIFEIASKISGGEPPDRRAVGVINEFAALPLAKVRLDFRSWRPEYFADAPVDAGLSAVARDAIDLFTGPQSKLIRTCAEPACRMLFVDSSPGARRRWCSMTRCGSRAKGAAFRIKHGRRRAGHVRLGQ